MSILPPGGQTWLGPSSSAPANSSSIMPHTIHPCHLNNVLAMGGNLWCHYFRCQGYGLITRITFIVGTQSGAMQVGVYDDTGSGAGAPPGLLLASAPQQGVPAAGVSSSVLSTPINVDPSMYLAIATDNGTCTFACFGANFQSNASLTVLPGFAYQQAGSAYPLPAIAAPTAAERNAIYGLYGS